jgi:hypothetical protein
MAPREESGGGLAIDRPAGGNWTVVHSAANWGQTEVLKYLLSMYVLDSLPYCYYYYIRIHI